MAVSQAPTVLARYAIDYSAFASSYGAMKNMFKELASESKKLESATSQAGANMERSFAHLGTINQHLQNGVQRVKGFAGGVLELGQRLGFGIIGLKGLADGLGGAANALFGSNASLEQTKIGFDKLLGSAQKSQQFINDLWDFAKKTPFEFNQLTDASYMLMGVGVEAKNVIPWLTAVGDAVSGVGGGAEQIQSATDAIATMAAQGKITSDQMEQLTTARIPAWELVAKAMGKSSAEVRDLASQGKLMSKDVLPLLIGQMEKTFGGQMSAQAGTFNGIMSTISDTWGDIIQALMSPVFAQVKTWFVELGKQLEKPDLRNFAVTIGTVLNSALKTAAEWFQKTVAWVSDLYSKVQSSGSLKVFGEVLGNIGIILKNAVNVALQLFTDLMGGVKSKGDPARESASGVAGAIKAIADASKGVTEFLIGFTSLLADTGIKGVIARDVLVGIGGAFVVIKAAQTGMKIAEFVKDIGSIAIEGGKAAIAMGQYAAKIVIVVAAHIALAATKMASFILSIVVALPGLIAGLVAWAAGAWAAAAGMIAATWPILLVVAAIAALIAIIVLLVLNWDKIVKWLQGVWGAVVKWLEGTIKGIAQWFSDLGTGVQTSLGGIGQWFTNLWTGIAATASSVWANIQGIFSAAIAFILGVVTLGFTSVYNAIIKPLEPLLGWFGSIFSAIGQIIIRLIQIAIDWLIAKFNEAYSFIVTIWTAVSSFFSAIFSAIYTTISGWISKAVGWITAQLTVAQQWFTVVWSAVSAYVSQIFQAIYTTISTYISKAVAWIQERLSFAQAIMSSIWSAISSTVSSIWSAIWNTIVQFVTNIYNSIVQKLTQARDWLASLWASISSTVSSVWNGIVTTVTGIVQTIYNNISSKFTQLKDFIAGVWKAVSDGVSSAWNGIVNTIRGVLNNMIGVLNSGLRGVQDFINGIVDGIINVGKALGLTLKIDHVSIGQVQPLASGTDFWPGGMALVGEQGPELAYLPRGSQVLPAGQTSRALNYGTTLHTPGLAGGVGDLLGTLLNWFISGVGSISSSFLKNFNISLPTLPGYFDKIGPALFSKITDGIGSYVNTLFGKSTTLGGQVPFTGNLPMAQRGQFYLPAGGGFHQMYWYGIHNGMDMQFPQGSVLREIIGGMVLPHTGWKDWGGEVDVRIPNGLWERYEHMSQIAVRAGQIVKRGDYLGLSGGGTVASGLGYWSNGAHLHIQYDTGSYSSGINPLNVWAAYGLYAPFSFGKGGTVKEPVFGVGMKSGKGYSIGESGPETVIPGSGITINLKVDGKTLASALGSALGEQIRIEIGGIG